MSNNNNIVIQTSQEIMIDFYERMKIEISNIDTLETAYTTISDIKGSENRNYWLLCYTLKHIKYNKLYAQGVSSDGVPYANMEEYAEEVFGYRGTSVNDFILIADQFEMEESAKYITAFGISKTRLLSRLKKENIENFKKIIKDEDEIKKSSVNSLLYKWFNQGSGKAKTKLYTTSVKDESYELYYLKARKVLENLPDKVDEIRIVKEDINKLYEFACFLKNKSLTEECIFEK